MLDIPTAAACAAKPDAMSIALQKCEVQVSEGEATRPATADGMDTRPPSHDWALELQNKILAPFTVAAVGDLIINRPVTELHDAGLQAVLDVVRGADLGVGNFETNIVDRRAFDGPIQGFAGDKRVAADIKAAGFHIVGRANNHTMDSGERGMFETDRLLDEAGVVHSGTGRHLEEARSANFVDVAQGRVGLVAAHPPVMGDTSVLATPRTGSWGGKAGLNGLQVSRSIIVSQEQFDALKQMRDQIFDGRSHDRWTRPAPVDPPGKLDVFGAMYEVGDAPGTNRYAMDDGDLQGNLDAIRDAKQRSHFLMTMIHDHEFGSHFERPAMNETPSNYVVDFAHASIDNGADMFIGTGPHLLRGIEIYRGKPIFYGLGALFHDIYQFTMPPALRAGRTNTETAVDFWDNGPGLKYPVNLESIVAVTKFDEGHLQELRLHPVDLRWEGTVVDNGLPRLASPEVATSILHRLQWLSSPFGTEITIEGTVGVIRNRAST